MLSNKLHKAIKENDTDAIGRILARRPQWANYVDADYGLVTVRYCPVNEALVHANDDTVRFIAARMDMSTYIPHWIVPESIVELAARNGRDVFVKEWLQNYSGIWQPCRAEANNVLLIAARQGNLPLVQWLLENKVADINASNDRGVTALGEAQASGDNHLIRYIYNFLQAQVKKSVVTGPRQEWSLIDAQTVAYARPQTGAGYRLTDIFNFAQGTCVTLYRNLETNIETPVQNTFAQLADTPALAEAQAQLARLGGRAGKATDTSIKKKVG